MYINYKRTTGLPDESERVMTCTRIYGLLSQLEEPSGESYYTDDDDNE